MSWQRGSAYGATLDPFSNPIINIADLGNNMEKIKTIFHSLKDFCDDTMGHMGVCPDGMGRKGLRGVPAGTLTKKDLKKLKRKILKQVHASLRQRENAEYTRPRRRPYPDKERRRDEEYSDRGSEYRSKRPAYSRPRRSRYY